MYARVSAPSELNVHRTGKQFGGWRLRNENKPSSEINKSTLTFPVEKITKLKVLGAFIQNAALQVWTKFYLQKINKSKTRERCNAQFRGKTKTQMLSDKIKTINPWEEKPNCFVSKETSRMFFIHLKVQSWRFNSQNLSNDSMKNTKYLQRASATVQQQNRMFYFLNCLRGFHQLDILPQTFEIYFPDEFHLFFFFWRIWDLPV